MIRLTCVFLTAVILLAMNQSIRLPRENVRWYVWAMGLLDTSAFVLSNRGMQMEQVAIVSVLGSLYGAVTVGLAAIFLKEHVAKWQWAGIVTIFVGIFLISL
jgi:drug/metabolite transporter (DMT)-like permease